MDFATALAKISTASQIATAAVPAIQQYSTDHVAATQQILQIAGAGVAAESNDKDIQAEAQASAQLAASLVPLVFQLAGLFKKKKS